MKEVTKLNNKLAVKTQEVKNLTEKITKMQEDLKRAENFLKMDKIAKSLKDKETKQTITIRLKKSTIEHLKKENSHYQTLINLILDTYVEAKTY
jgi:uncharacterized protein (DUF4415 family)